MLFAAVLFNLGDALIALDDELGILLIPRCASTGIMQAIRSSGHQCRNVEFHGYGPLDPAAEAFSLFNLPHWFPFKFFGRLSISAGLQQTTVEGSATLNGKRLIVQIANDLCPRF
jgi:hypothetical protein